MIRLNPSHAQCIFPSFTAMASHKTFILLFTIISCAIGLIAYLSATTTYNTKVSEGIEIDPEVLVNLSYIVTRFPKLDKRIQELDDMHFVLREARLHIKHSSLPPECRNDVDVWTESTMGAIRSIIDSLTDLSSKMPYTIQVFLSLNINSLQNHTNANRDKIPDLIGNLQDLSHTSRIALQRYNFVKELIKNRGDVCKKITHGEFQTKILWLWNVLYKNNMDEWLYHEEIRKFNNFLTSFKEKQKLLENIYADTTEIFNVLNQLLSTSRNNVIRMLSPKDCKESLKLSIDSLYVLYGKNVRYDHV